MLLPYVLCQTYVRSTDFHIHHIYNIITIIIGIEMIGPVSSMLYARLFIKEAEFLLHLSISRPCHLCYPI